MSTTDVAPPIAGGRYRLLRVLGTGGMATVYEAHDARLDVRRAIKVLEPGLFTRPKIRDRFEAEARTMARLVHRHICTVHDVGVDGDRAFIVMEYIEGGTLQDRIERGEVGARQAAEWMCDVLDALAAAHAAGVIHRDLKPHNVLLTRDGTVRLGDFGIAQLADPERSSVTKTGAVLGTPAFMPPEQKNDARSVGPAADVYAAGATLFALVTGREPFDLYAHDAKAELLPLVPPALAPIVDRATRYQPADRFSSAEAMRDALRAAVPALDGLAPAPLPALPAPTHASTFALDDEPVPPPRRRVGPAAFAVVGLLGVVAAALAVWANGDEEAPTPVATAPAPAPAPVTAPQPAPAPPPAPAPVVAPLPAPAPATRPQRAPPPPAPEPVAVAEPEPERAPEPDPPAPAPVAPGVPCRFSSTLPATVSIDGQAVGPTPYVGECAPGKRKVVIAPASGGASFVRTFPVEKPFSYCHDFEANGPCK